MSTVQVHDDNNWSQAAQLLSEEILRECPTWIEENDKKLKIMQIFHTAVVYSLSTLIVIYGELMKSLLVTNQLITVEPRFSGPQLCGTSIIWTCATPLNALIRMRRGHD